jgi:hypothetical protein
LIIFFFFLLGGEPYIVRSGAILSCYLDMRKKKHSLHYVVDNELLSHSIVNIPDKENIHIGVLFYYFYLFIYIFIYLFALFYIYILFSFFLIKMLL